VIEIIKELASEQGIKVRILLKMEKEVESSRIIKELSQRIGLDEQNPSINYRPILHSVFHTKITTFIVDSTFSLTLEIDEAAAAVVNINKSFEESVGIAIYSNNQSTVDSYATIFENL